jgi:glycoprotein-N-acetylgalactosamine 3-beta-galactosyltransferase
MANKTNRFVFISGLFFGSLLYQFIPSYFRSYKIEDEAANFKLIDSKNYSEVSFELYKSELAEKLFNEVRVVCWINMAPKYHKTKAIHIKNTWGRRCHKLIFMSHEDDPELPAVKLPVPEGLDHFWKKFKLAFEYIYDNHLNDGDYFLKADDDTYIVMENLRQMLYQYRPQTALFFGHRYARVDTPAQGFMQGGCYVMSKKLLIKFVTQLAHNLTLCGPEDGWMEDIYMGEKKKQFS